MKKVISIILILLVVGGAFVLLNSKDNYDSSKYYLSKDSGSIDFKLPDQFDKAHSLKSDTKIVIVAFVKKDGHTVREYLKNHNPSLLQNNHAFFIADISKVPVVIRNMFILKDLKKSKFPVLLIYDKKISKSLKENKEGIMILHLDNKVIKSTDYIHNQKQLDKLFKK